MNEETLLLEHPWLLLCGCLVLAVVLGWVIWRRFRKKSVENARPGPFVLIDRPDGPRYRCDIAAPEVTIGSDVNSDIYLNDASVELHHAAINTWRSGNVYVIDRSVSGIVLNGEKVVGSQLVIEGAQLRVGGVSMIFAGLSPDSFTSVPFATPAMKRSTPITKSKLLIGCFVLAVLLGTIKMSGMYDEFFRGLASSEHVEVDTSSFRILPLEVPTPPPLTGVAEIRDCDVCPPMISIPGGIFYRGSPKDEEGHLKTEEPLRRVSIDNFYLAKNLVTREEWNACLSDGGCNGALQDVSTELNKNLPATNVTFWQATAYALWLNDRSGMDTFRLPNEAEWEYAARAGSQSRFVSGDDESTLNDTVWYLPNSKSMNPVGTKNPNKFGLYDMGGNAFQWTQDCWNRDYGGAPTNGKAMLAGDCSAARVIRGGAWNNVARNVRPASRFDQNPEAGSAHLGFRVARSP